MRDCSSRQREAYWASEARLAREAQQRQEDAEYGVHQQSEQGRAAAVNGFMRLAADKMQRAAVALRLEASDLQADSRLLAMEAEKRWLAAERMQKRALKMRRSVLT